ncbi:unnamed protein product [Echinostoma caproni]|uniref:MTTase N-terminal domain-containing protein n=1 Tax=Echinostoma caproni TaxID=27848 RepID=A0A182ZZN4_9TREM|nr:unnamed protein product [Echinostoma caproni]
MAGLLAKYGYRVTLGGSSDTPIVPLSAELTDNHATLSVDPPQCDCGADGSVACCQTVSTGDSTVCGGGDEGEDEKEGHGECGSCARSDPRSKRDEQAKAAADLWVLNSCTVKGPAEDHFRNAVTAGIQLGKRIVVAGCVPQSRPGANYLKGVSIIGVQQIDRIVEVVEETLQGTQFCLNCFGCPVVCCCCCCLFTRLPQICYSAHN